MCYKEKKLVALREGTEKVPYWIGKKKEWKTKVFYSFFRILK